MWGLLSVSAQDMSSETWVVGPEYDTALLSKLGGVLRSLGYDLETRTSGIGGSQQLSRWEVIGPKGFLVIESETYIGLCVSGTSELLAEVKARF